MPPLSGPPPRTLESTPTSAPLATSIVLFAIVFALLAFIAMI